MNNIEKITNIQNDIKKLVEDYTIFTEGAELFERILNVFEELKKPQSLAEFLGWEEDVVYKCNSDKFIIMDGKLYIRNYASTRWCVAYDISINRFEQLRQAKKVEIKKYHLKLKRKYVDFFDTFGGKNLLSLYDCKDFMISDVSCEDDKNQIEFTEEEINNIVLPEPLSLDMFDKVEVK